MQRSYGWCMFAGGSFILADNLLRYQFRPTAGKGIILSAIMAVVVAIVGLWLLRRKQTSAGNMTIDPRSETPDSNTFTVTTHGDVAMHTQLMVEALGQLPDDADAARAMIEQQIRARYNVLARALADRPELGGPRRVELQMALGDFMTRVEKIWTTLADGATAHARDAWREAQEPQALARLTSLLAV